jgi:hypothetical protein
VHADSLAPDTLIFGADSLQTQGQSDTVKDLSGTFGASPPKDSGSPVPKRSGRKR